VVEHLPRKRKALGSVPSSGKKRTKKKKKRYGEIKNLGGSFAFKEDPTPKVTGKKTRERLVGKQGTPVPPGIA